LGSTQPISESHYQWPRDLKYKLGDCLYFKANDTTYGCVVVCDFSKDSAGIWYAAFYSGYDSVVIPTLSSIKTGKVMGRKVESGIDPKGYTRYLDGDLIHDSIFTNSKNFTLLGNMPLKDGIELGSYGIMTSMSDVKVSFKQRIEFRLKVPDHYTEHLKKLDNFHPEQYFRMSEFIK